MKDMSVDDYIALCPSEVRDKLESIRSLIMGIAPKARERTDYFRIPGYSIEGYNYDGMFAWFSYKAPYIRIHVRPPVLQNYQAEIVGYKATKAIISFPEKIELPLELIKNLVEASIDEMKSMSK